tara:strand:+ start:490 stop:795 length:306 start_codon:yes stop_codon:yes gene_type:complete
MVLSGQQPVNPSANLDGVVIRGGEVPTQFKIQARGNVYSLSISPKCLEAGGEAVVPHVALIPRGHSGSIDTENEQAARVAVSVVVSADVLKIHCVAACDEP